MSQFIFLLALLFQTSVLCGPLAFNAAAIAIRTDTSEGQLDPAKFGNSITYCSPVADHVPCTDDWTTQSEVHMYMNATLTAHFECFVTDPFVGFVDFT
jgi:hypothetical protein